VRRASLTGVLAAAALAPPVVWLLPALLRREAPTRRDQGDFFFPLKLYTADRLRAGEIALWNPWSGAGEPWLANGQSGVFYPPTLFFLIPSPALAAALFLLLHFGIAAWGTWRFAKDEGISDAGALAAAAVFAGSGVTASFSAYWNHFGALAYLPAIAAVARSGLRTRRAPAALALLLGLQAMAGSPEMTAMTLALVAALAFFPRPEPEDGWRSPTRGERWRRFVLGGVLGLALAAWVLVPMGELALHSARRLPIPGADREAGAVTLEAAATSLAPIESSNFFLASFYVGPAAVLCAIAAFAESEKRRLVVVLAAAGAAGLFLAVAAPPGSWLRTLPGIDRVRYPAKAIAPSLFALALLAGIGLDALRFSATRRFRLAVAVLAAGAGLAAVALGEPPALRVCVGLGLVALALLALRKDGASASAGALAAAAALSIAVSFAIANRAFFRFAPEAEIRRVPEPVEFLAKVPGRTLTAPMDALSGWVLRDASFDAATLRRQRESLIGYTNLLAGVRTVRTAAALPTAAAARIASTIDADHDPARAAGPAGARVYWSPFQPGELGSKKVGEFFRAPLNPYRLRVSFVSDYRVEKGAEAAWSRVAEGRSDWSRSVLLDREPVPRPEAGPGRYIVARIAEDRPERVAADITTETAGLLVLADLHYPGWTARVDDRPAPLLRADGFFRAVAVPAGAHRVEFRYRPLSFLVGSAVSILALGATLFVLVRGPAPARRPA
jgi:hypothetical protein